MATTTAATISTDAGCLETAVRRIVDPADPVGVILFGSRARDDHDPRSDFDILVIVPDSVQDRVGLAASLIDDLSDLPLAVDILVTGMGEINRLRDTPGYVFREALREGRILYGGT